MYERDYIRKSTAHNNPINFGVPYAAHVVERTQSRTVFHLSLHSYLPNPYAPSKGVSIKDPHSTKPQYLLDYEIFKSPNNKHTVLDNVFNGNHKDVGKRKILLNQHGRHKWPDRKSVFLEYSNLLEMGQIKYLEDEVKTAWFATKEAIFNYFCANSDLIHQLNENFQEPYEVLSKASEIVQTAMDQRRYNCIFMGLPLFDAKGNARVQPINNELITPENIKKITKRLKKKWKGIFPCCDTELNEVAKRMGFKLKIDKNSELMTYSEYLKKHKTLPPNSLTIREEMRVPRIDFWKDFSLEKVDAIKIKV